MSARVLVTGGSGFIGSQVVDRLATEAERVVSVDVRAGEAPGPVRFVEMDVRDPALVELVAEEGIDRIVHLAAMVTPGPQHTRELLYEIDVGGTRNVVNAAVAAGVDHLTVMSSGAAYGYHADHPDWIDESVPLRGNPEFAYADHKRIVEEDLERVRRQHPGLDQLVLRPGTVLGDTVDNQLTAMFGWPVVLGIAGSESPFVFVWVDDLVEVVVRGSLERRTGIYNVAGDGAMPLREIAGELDKPYVPIPAAVVRGALSVLHRMGATPYGPEQVSFLRYRPVLSNHRLGGDFGYRPGMTTREAFRAWRASRG